MTRLSLQMLNEVESYCLSLQFLTTSFVSKENFLMYYLFQFVGCKVRLVFYPATCLNAFGFVQTKSALRIMC